MAHNPELVPLIGYEKAKANHSGSRGWLKFARRILGARQK